MTEAMTTKRLGVVHMPLRTPDTLQDVPEITQPTNHNGWKHLVVVSC